MAALAVALVSVVAATPASAKTVGDCHATAEAYADYDYARITDTTATCTYMGIRHTYGNSSGGGTTAIVGGTGSVYRDSTAAELQAGIARLGPAATIYQDYTVAPGT